MKNYEWDVSPDKIILDETLNLDKLGWKHGDMFKITNVNGRAMLKKMDQLEKFVRSKEYIDNKTNTI